MAYDVVFISGKNLYGLDIQTGEILWEHRDIGRANQAQLKGTESPIIANGQLYFYAYPFVKAVDIRTGQINGRDLISFRSVILTQGVLCNGVLYHLDLKKERVLCLPCGTPTP